jgi:hypothetical protein
MECQKCNKGNIAITSDTCTDEEKNKHITCPCCRDSWEDCPSCSRGESFSDGVLAYYHMREFQDNPDETDMEWIKGWFNGYFYTLSEEIDSILESIPRNTLPNIKEEAVLLLNLKEKIQEIIQK